MPAKPLGDTTMPTSELADLLLCAFRYALGRRTYITSTVSQLLDKYWQALPGPWHQLVHEEIREAIARGHAGDACDQDSWQKLLLLPVATA